MAADARLMSARPPSPEIYKIRGRFGSNATTRQFTSSGCSSKAALERGAWRSARSLEPDPRGERASRGVHDGERGRARSNGEDDRRACALSQIRHDARDIRTLIVNEAVHCDHVVELAERRIKHVAGAEGRGARPGEHRRTFARKADERRRNVDTDDRRAALGEFERERARPAARVENASALKVDRAANRESSRASRRARRGRSRGRG